MTTPILSLDELIAAQSQPHVPVNSTFRKLDAIVHLSVATIGTEPSGSPAPVEGDRFISTDGGTLDQIGLYQSSAWTYITPGSGWIAYVEDEDAFYYFIDAASSPNGWTLLETGGTGVSDHGALTGLADDDHTQYLKRTEVVSQAVAEAGTSTTAYAWTPQRVAQAIAALESGGGGGGAAFIGAKVYMASAPSQSIVSATETALTDWDTAAYDVDSMWAGDDSPAYPSRIYVPEAGKYLVTANIKWPASGMTASFTQLWFRVNGTGNGYGKVLQPAANDLMVSATVVLDLSANDYIEAMAYHATGTNKTLTLSGEQAFSVTKIAVSQTAISLGVFFPGTPTSSQLMWKFVADRDFTFPINFAGALGDIGTNPTASFAMDVSANDTTIGTVTVSTGGVFTFATSGGTTKDINAGDYIEVTGPSSTDATAADIAFTLVGQ